MYVNSVNRYRFEARLPNILVKHLGKIGITYNIKALYNSERQMQWE